MSHPFRAAVDARDLPALSVVLAPESVRPEHARRRALIMVSTYDHCLVDLLYRHETGELPIDIPAVVSNHEDCRALVERHGIPFVYRPVTSATKATQEDDLLRLVVDLRIDLVVLARYMQVMSAGVCRELAGRMINIFIILSCRVPRALLLTIRPIPEA